MKKRTLKISIEEILDNEKEQKKLIKKIRQKRHPANNKGKNKKKNLTVLKNMSKQINVQLDKLKSESIEHQRRKEVLNEINQTISAIRKLPKSVEINPTTTLKLTQALTTIDNQHNNHFIISKTLNVEYNEYYLLPNIPTQAVCIIGNPAVNSSGDVYHILSYIALARTLNYEAPLIVYSYDNEQTKNQAQRSAAFAKQFGFDFGVIDLPYEAQTKNKKVITHKNSRLAYFINCLSYNGKQTYFIDQKATTLFLAEQFKQNGFEKTTKFIQDSLMGLLKDKSNVSPSEKKEIEGWVDSQFKTITEQYKDSGKKHILLFNNRTGIGANASQDMGNQEEVNDFEKIADTQDAFVWYLIAGSDNNTGKDSTFLFNSKPEWDEKGLNKIRHLLLLIKLLELSGLVGMVGNTSGTLDIAAFIGHRVYCRHVFDAPDGSIDDQDYRMLLQGKNILKVGLPILKDSPNPFDKDGKEFENWIQEGKNKNKTSLNFPPNLLQKREAKKDITHEHRLPFSGALTWPIKDDLRKEQLDASPKIFKTLGRKDFQSVFIEHSIFKTHDNELQKFFPDPLRKKLDFEEEESINKKGKN